MKTAMKTMAENNTIRWVASCCAWNSPSKVMK
jgi:hypothetical protein